MDGPPLPAWDDPYELIRVMTGEWQPLAQPLTQEQTLPIFNLVTAGLLQCRFSVEASDIEDSGRFLRFKLVAGGDYGGHLEPVMRQTVNDLTPPNRNFNVTRRLSAFRRTARGAEFVASGFPAELLELQPPMILPCDVRWDSVADASTPAPEPSVAKEDVGNGNAGENIVEYLGLRLDLDRRKLHGNGQQTDLDPVQTAVLIRLLKSRDAWLKSEAIETAITTAKTRLGQQPYQSADPKVVVRVVSELRKALTPLGYSIKNDRFGGYRVEAGYVEPKKTPRKKVGTRRKEVRKKSGS